MLARYKMYSKLHTYYIMLQKKCSTCKTYYIFYLYIIQNISRNPAAPLATLDRSLGQPASQPCIVNIVPVRSSREAYKKEQLYTISSRRTRSVAK